MEKSVNVDALSNQTNFFSAAPSEALLLSLDGSWITAHTSGYVWKSKLIYEWRSASCHAGCSPEKYQKSLEESDRVWFCARKLKQQFSDRREAEGNDSLGKFVFSHSLLDR